MITNNNQGTLSPAVNELWLIVETMYGRKITWEHSRDLADIRLGSRIEEDGTPIIGYGDHSVINDQSVSHELLHLWRFGCGVPIVNTQQKAWEARLHNVQNEFEHLWIYTVQEAPPFNMQPWNKPHTSEYVREAIDFFQKATGRNLSWGTACDVTLSRPHSEQVNRQEVSKISRREDDKVEQILRHWCFENIDSAQGAADSYMRILEIIGFDLMEISLRWQAYDGLFKPKMIPVTATLPEFSSSTELVKTRTDARTIVQINDQRHKHVSAGGP